MDQDTTQDRGKEYPMSSGAMLLASQSDFARTIELHDALLDVLRGQGLGVLDVAQLQKAIVSAAKRRESLLKGEALEEEDASAAAGLNVLVDKVLALASSKRFKDALFSCAVSAQYCPDGRLETALSFDPDKPGYGVFDDFKYGRQARKDFYDICRAIAEENLRPFGEALLSALSGRVDNGAASLASNTAKV